MLGLVGAAVAAAGCREEEAGSRKGHDEPDGHHRDIEQIAPRIA